MAKDTASAEKIAQLSEMQRYVTQHRGTEPPFTGALLHNKQEGIYHCLVCNAPLFLSETKYDSGCGWPSFYQPVSDDASATSKMIPTVCTGLKSAVATVMRIWGMCSRMAHSQQASATV